MVASIGKIASPSQGVGYFEKDGYYARDGGAHREASAWAGRGAEALGLSGPVDPERFRSVLEGEVPGGRRLGRREIDGTIAHRPGRDVTLSAPKSVSLMAMVGGDERIVEAHDKAVTATLGWIEKNAVETRMRGPATGAMIRTGGQKTVAALFRHDTSRNLDPQLHTHAVVANMVQGEDGKWRTMVDDGLFKGKMAIGAIYRAELAQGLKGLGYGIEKIHADGRFEIEGVPREVIDAFSTRRAEIEAAMAERGMGESKDNPHLAARAALMTRAAKRDIDRGELGRSWQRQAKGLGFSASKVCAQARKAERGLLGPDLFAGPGYVAGDAAAWVVGHLAERQSVFGHADLLAATLAREPGAVTVDAAGRAIAALEREGSLHAARGLDHGRYWTTDAAMARESEIIALMRAGQGAEKTVMRRWMAETKLHRDRLNEGQKEAVKTILASKDRVVAVQGYAGTGKTTMLKRLRALAAFGDDNGYTPMTAAEAQTHADRGWQRWVPVVDALAALEAAPVPQQQVVTLPAVSVSAGADVTEGGDAVFTVTASPAPAAALSVTVTVATAGEFGVTAGSQSVTIPTTGSATLLTVTLSVVETGGGDHVAAADEGPATATIAKGATEAVFSVATVDDDVDEPDGAVTVTLKDGGGYTVPPSQGAAAVTVSDNDAAVGPVFSVDDATGQENGRLPVMPFTVRLSAPAQDAVRVYVSTRPSTPVSATPKVDYAPASSALTFRAGETEKQVWVRIYNDSHDEEPETFEVVLSAARGAPVGDGVAVGTIVNDDPMPAAWLARFGRTVAEQALDGIAGRMSADRTPGMRGSIAGQALSFDPAANDNPGSRSGAGAAPAHAPDGAAVPGGTGALALADVAQAFGGQSGPGGLGHDAAGFANGTQPRGMTAREALLGSSFSLTGQADGSGGSMAFWGRGSQARFDGREGTFSLDGAVTTGMLGADYARGKWLVGLGLATGARDYSLGWRLTPETANAPDLSFGLRATRRESDTAEAEHTVGFEVNARW